MVKVALKNMKLYFSNFIKLFFSRLSSQKSLIRIALIAPVPHAPALAIQSSFMRTLEQGSPGNCFFFSLFNGDGTHEQTEKDLEHVVSRNFDFILTLGIASTRAAKRIVSKHNKHIPIIFTAVESPVENRLVSSIEHSDNFLTGVATDTTICYEELFQHLHTLSPDIRRILVVYDDTDEWLENEKNKVKDVVQTFGGALHTISLHKKHDLITYLSESSDKIDALMILRDHLALLAIDDIVVLCNTYRIPLLATDIYSTGKGAAFGFGPHEDVSGTLAAQKVLQLMSNNNPVSCISIANAHYRNVVSLNERAMNRQGMNINQDVFNLIKKVEIR